MATTEVPVAEPELKLPSPEDRPGADVVIYDGSCGFCRSQVARLARWDTQSRLAFVPLQDPAVLERYPDLTRERLLQEMVVVDRSGRRHGGADAFRYLSRRIRQLWWLAPWMHIPGSMPLWRLVYRLVARHRYRLWSRRHPCDSGTCSLRR